MYFKQLKWLYIVGFVVVVGLVIGGGFWWINQGEGSEKTVSKEVASGNKMEVVEDEQMSEEEKTKKETGAELVSEGEIDTSDWKMYRNDEYGFSFRYPASWKIRSWGEIIAALSTLEKFIRLEEGSIEETDDVKIITISKNSTQNIEDFSRTVFDGWYGHYDKVNSVLINGIEGIQYSDISNIVPQIPHVATFLDNKDRVIIITLHEVTSDEVLKNYSMIVSSFYFQ